MGPATVWVVRFDGPAPVYPLVPIQREWYVRNTQAPLLRAQRYAVWHLLDMALNERIGTGVEHWNIRRESNGMWICPEMPIRFSLSHSSNVAAVALYEHPIGMDLQALSAFTDPDRLARRILSAKEYRRFLSLKEQGKLYLAERWSAKEATFKYRGMVGDISRQSEPVCAETVAEIVRVGDEHFSLAIAY